MEKWFPILSKLISFLFVLNPSFEFPSTISKTSYLRDNSTNPYLRDKRNLYSRDWEWMISQQEELSAFPTFCSPSYSTPTPLHVPIQKFLSSLTPKSAMIRYFVVFKSLDRFPNFCIVHYIILRIVMCLNMFNTFLNNTRWARFKNKCTWALCLHRGKG